MPYIRESLGAFQVLLWNRCSELKNIRFFIGISIADAIRPYRAPARSASGKPKPRGVDRPRGYFMFKRRMFKISKVSNPVVILLHALVLTLNKRSDIGR